MFDFIVPGTILGSAFGDHLTGNDGCSLSRDADVYDMGTGSNFVSSFTPGGDEVDVSSLGTTSIDQLTIDGSQGFVASVSAKASEVKFSREVFSSIDADSFIFAPGAPGLFVAKDTATSIELVGKHAAFNNALGVFEVDDDGSIDEVEIVIPDSQDTSIGSQVALDGINLGDQFGFFRVQDEDLSGLDGSFALANAATGDALTLDHLLGEETAAGLVFTYAHGEQRTIDVPVFHSVDRGDGGEQARTTEGDEGSRPSFEDLDVNGHSDKYFNDLEILVTPMPAAVA